MNPGGPSPELWARIEALFLEALDLPPSERGDFLEARCEGDYHLRDEVASLLASHDSEGLLPQPDDDRPFRGRYPERVGRCRIVRPLGEGGMGVVFLAIREGDGFEQTVALKLLRGSFADPLLVQRMEAERSILARLEHPGIARLIDGGVTEDGQPFYAMEYVAGESILAWSDAQALDLDGRIDLFLQVCEAVDHAHRQLVVHRDLKPSNILVTPDGTPKLLDFGIAKSLEDTQGVLHTGLWVTPAYASPEQVTGAPVTPGSDVYSLGVLLCELLTGSRPYKVEATAPAEVARVIAEEQPRKPSELARDGLTGKGGREDGETRPSTEQNAARRSTTPRRLSRTLEGDLDVIVSKALAKDPERRYRSAYELAEDLRRYRAGRPILARPDTTAYRVRKFVARNRGISAVAALLVVAVVSGVTATVWQAGRAATERDRAEQEASRARQVTALMTDIFRLADPLQSRGDTLGVRQVLQEGAARVESDLADDPLLQATLFLELARVYRSMGILDQSQHLAARASQIRRREEPDGAALAEALGFEGMLAREAGESARSIELLEEAIALRRSGSEVRDTSLASLLVGLGWEVRSAADYERAGALFREALEIQEAALPEGDPAIAGTLLGLASTYHDQGAFDESEEVFRSALDRGALDRPDPVAASALVNLGMIRRLREHYAEAAGLVRPGLEMWETLFEPDHPSVIQAREQWAATLVALGRYGEAEPLYREVLDQAIRVLGEEHIRTRSTREGLAGLDWTFGRYREALARMDTVVQAKDLAHGGDHPGTVYTLVSMGEVAVDAGQLDEAEQWFSEALSMGERLGGTQGVYGALARSGQARVALARNELPLADSLSRVALDLALESLRPDHRYVLEIQRVRGGILLAQGNGEAVVPLMAEVREAEARVRPSPHPRLGQTDLLAGEAYLALGRRPEAAAAFRRALDEFAELPAGHPLRQEAEEGLNRSTR